MSEDQANEAVGADLVPDEIDEPKPSQKRPKRRKRRVIIPIVVVVIIVAAVFVGYRWFGKQPAQASSGYSDYTVSTRDITLSLSGTGTLEPADSYTVTGLVSGEIQSAPFEEGDIVQKDSVLYTIDSSDAQTSIDQATSSLAQSQRAYNQTVSQLDDLTVKSNAAGTVTDLLVSVGDKVTAGQPIAKIRDSSTMSLVIPFNSTDATGFYTGESATVTLDGSFEQVGGSITKIATVDDSLDGNMLVRQVTIDVSNPGGIAQDSAATAMVGNIACNSGGTFSYKSESTVNSSAAGDVSSINVKEGGWVNKNQTILTLSSTTLQNSIENSLSSLHDSQLSLDNKNKQLDNYTITSPISGTIVEKMYKEGDKMDPTKSLCTIFDLSYLTMTLKVDELDISKVQVGQAVTITADALSGQEFEGSVTKVNINGTTSGGVTSYPVTIRLDKTDGLLPGMNVQANIVVSQAKGAVAIPVSALRRGNFVLVKADAASGEAQPSGTTSATDNGGAQGFGQRQRPQNGQYPQSGQFEQSASPGDQTGQQDQSNQQGQPTQQGQPPQSDQSAQQGQAPQSDQSTQQGQGQRRQGQGQGQGFGGNGNGGDTSGAAGQGGITMPADSSATTPDSSGAVSPEGANTPAGNAGTPPQSGGAGTQSGNPGSQSGRPGAQSGNSNMPSETTGAPSGYVTGVPEGYVLVHVTPGISDGNFIEITSGLNVGDVIAVQQEVTPTATSNFGFMPAGGGVVRQGNFQAGGPPAGGNGGGTVTYNRGAAAGG